MMQLKARDLRNSYSPRKSREGHGTHHPPESQECVQSRQLAHRLHASVAGLEQISANKSYWP